MIQNRRSNLSARLAGLPFTGHRSPFIVRSASSSVVALVVVALAAGGWGFGAWAGFYLLAGVWALFFFALTPLIIREAVFSQRTGRTLALIALKLLWMGLMIGLCTAASDSQTPNLGLAVIAGVTTPLATVTLCALGSLLVQPGRPKQRNASIGMSQ